MKRGLAAGCVAAVAGLLMAALPAAAHHGAAAFDVTRMVHIEGTVSELRFINPHALLVFDVKQGDGGVQKWSGELTSPNQLARAGWSRHVLKRGDRVTIFGYLARDGANTIWIHKVVLADGRVLRPSRGN